MYIIIQRTEIFASSPSQFQFHSVKRQPCAKRVDARLGDLRVLEYIVQKSSTTLHAIAFFFVSMVELFKIYSGRRCSLAAAPA